MGESLIVGPTLWDELAFVCLFIVSCLMLAMVVDWLHIRKQLKQIREYLAIEGGVETKQKRDAQQSSR